MIYAQTNEAIHFIRLLPPLLRLGELPCGTRVPLLRGPVFGLAMDIVAFGVVPGWQAFVGGIVIIVASIQLLRTSGRLPESAAKE